MGDTEVCPSCSGSGFRCDDAAAQHQVCTTLEDCRRCHGTGRIPRQVRLLTREGALR